MGAAQRSRAKWALAGFRFGLLVLLGVLALPIIIGTAGAGAGGVMLANPILAGISSNPTITSYANGAAQAAVMPVADFLAPRVPCARRITNYKSYDQKQRFRIPDTIREIGGDATKVGFGGSTVPLALDAHALDFPFDYDEADEEADLMNHAREGADFCSQLGSLSHEKTTVDLALGAAGAGTDSNFTDAATDPVDLLDAEIENVLLAAKFGSALGVRIVMGATAWRRTKNNAKVLARYRGKVRQGSAPDLNDFGALLLSKPEVRTSFMVFDDAPQGVDEDIKFMLDDAILIFAALENPTRFDPSFMKTFFLRDKWMVPGGYEKQDGRGGVVKFDWTAKPVVTNSAAIKRINAKNA
ncbi:MAG: hypothetical protein ACPHCN_11860 [Mycobacterium sp.]